MELLVFGASGRVGRRLCAHAAADGHSVTAFVSAAARAPEGASVVEGDVTDPDAVAAAVGGQDAVCSALGPNDGDAVFDTGIENLVAAMEASDVERLVAVAAAGVLQATPGRLDVDGFPETLRPIADEPLSHRGRLPPRRRPVGVDRRRGGARLRRGRQRSA